MLKFVIAYHGTPKFETKEDGVDHMTAWHEWSQSLGDAVVDPGMPVGPSKTITQNGDVVDGGGSNPLSGITIIQADTMDHAIDMTKTCPHISAGGTIEIAEAMQMEM